MLYGRMEPLGQRPAGLLDLCFGDLRLWRSLGWSLILLLKGFRV